jgi:hypothetical protein
MKNLFIGEVEESGPRVPSDDLMGGNLVAMIACALILLLMISA